MKALKIENLHKNYTTKKNFTTNALNGINMSLNCNEYLGIMGPSGSGKTTLLNVASGIDSCDEGEIHICDQNITQMSKNELSVFRRENIGMVFQDFNLLDSLSIEENIMIPLILDQKYEIMESDRVRQIANVFGIEEIIDKYPYEISGGQLQRAAICRALINNPKIIFADEPTGNLDSKSSESVLSYFELARDNFNASILMVTHDPFSASYCDRIVFLRDGLIIHEIKKSGTSANFFKDILDAIQQVNKKTIEA